MPSGSRTPRSAAFQVSVHMARHERLQRAAWIAAAERDRAAMEAAAEEEAAIIAREAVMETSKQKVSARKRAHQETSLLRKNELVAEKVAAQKASEEAAAAKAASDAAAAAQAAAEKNSPRASPRYGDVCWALEAADAWAEISDERESSRRESSRRSGRSLSRRSKTEAAAPAVTQPASVPMRVPNVGMVKLDMTRLRPPVVEGGRPDEDDRRPPTPAAVVVARIQAAEKATAIMSQSTDRVMRSSPSPSRQARAHSPYMVRTPPAQKPPPAAVPLAPPTSAVASVDTPPAATADISPRRMEATHLRLHTHALLSAIGTREHFEALTDGERRKNILVLTKFLCTVAPPGAPATVEDDDETHGDGDGDEECAEAAAMTLASGLRRTGALNALAFMAGVGGHDAQLAFSCLANLARLGLVDALCQEPAVRTAVVNGLIASRHDEALLGFSLQCAYNLSSHPLMLRSLVAASIGVTPMLVRHINPPRRRRTRAASPAQADGPDAATLTMCAQKVLARMRTSKAHRRASAAVLRDNPDDAASAKGGWLIGWLVRRKGKKGSRQEEGIVSVPNLETTVVI